MILASDIDYAPFTDEQVASFSHAAGIEYANKDSSWRDELNEAARDLLFDYCAKEWPTPSKMIKELRRVAKDPDGFLRRLAIDERHKGQPAVTAILHGTKWQPSRLNEADKYRDEFLKGVNREIDFLTTVVARRKKEKITGNSGTPGFALFIERVGSVFRDAFWADVNHRLDGNLHSGSFIAFSKKIVSALEENLPTVLRRTDIGLKLKVIAGDGNTAIWNALLRSDCYRLSVSGCRGKEKQNLI